ncbi:topoisomerase [Ruminococcus sp. AM28-29LB]|nr:topoisomerase [Ruminococcus sp. AM28-29LB]
MINDNFFFIVNSTFQKTTFSVLKKSFYGCSNYPECKFTLAEHFRKKKLTKTNVKELLEGKETLVKGIKNKEKKPYNAVVKIGEKGYIDFIRITGGKRNPGKRNQKQREKALQCRCKNWGKGIY